MIKRIDDKDCHASGFASLLVRIEPEPGTYYMVLNDVTETSDTTDEVILDNIIKKHDGAWKRLARL